MILLGLARYVLLLLFGLFGVMLIALLRRERE